MNYYRVQVNTYDENGIQPFSEIVHEKKESAQSEIDAALHNPKYAGYYFWIEEIEVWSGYHSNVIAKTGTFERIYNDCEGNEEDDQI